MKQRTRKTDRFDHSCVDEDTPDAPECSCIRSETGELQITCTAYDSQTIYQYLVEGYDSENVLVGISDTINVNASSNISHLRYWCTNSSLATEADILSNGVDVYGLTIRNTVLDGYCHVAAVDESENVSPIASYRISESCPSTLSMSFTPKIHEDLDGNHFLLTVCMFFVYVIH